MTAQPREEKGHGDISNVYKCLEAGCKEDGARSFPVVPRAGTRGNRPKLKDGRLVALEKDIVINL